MAYWSKYFIIPLLVFADRKQKLFFFLYTLVWRTYLQVSEIEIPFHADKTSNLLLTMLHLLFFTLYTKMSVLHDVPSFWVISGETDNCDEATPLPEVTTGSNDVMSITSGSDLLI